jgi:hypothetical protein
VKYRRNELDAARILAYANTAAYDAIIACFYTKFHYWFIRPSQADAAITTPVGLPNHPSYPSAHSCETGAFQGVLVPSSRASAPHWQRLPRKRAPPAITPVCTTGSTAKRVSRSGVPQQGWRCSAKVSKTEWSSGPFPPRRERVP